MKLTRKAEVAFKKWFFEVYCKNTKRENMKRLMYLGFLSKSDSEKYGVYVDWLLSVDLYPEIYTSASGCGFCITKGVSNGTSVFDDHRTFDSVPQARTAAIQKANEKFNNLK